MTVDEVQAEVPNWPVDHDDGRGWRAFSPTHKVDGMVLTAQEPHQLIERVRNVERIIAIAAGRAGDRDPTAKVASVAVRRRTPDRASSRSIRSTTTPSESRRRRDALAQTIGQARTMGYTGSFCQDCSSSRMVRNGACEKCLDCGTSSGCS